MNDTKSVVVARLLYNNETCYLSKVDFPLKRGDNIIIETANGPEVALVSGMGSAGPEGNELGHIIRKCTDEDLSKKEENNKKEEEAFGITLEKIQKHNLEMKLVSIHCFLDDTKIIFNFTADGRIDFRELVKDLASIFKKRIELRQIGARDEAKIITGCGVCGRDFCCNTIKNELQPVTIKMAKEQNLTLNSSKISGACGRLLCCLAYEHEAYCAIKKDYPLEGSILHYQGKEVILSEINIQKMTATLKTEDNVSIVLPLDELPTPTLQMEKKESVADTERVTSEM